MTEEHWEDIRHTGKQLDTQILRKTAAEGASESDLTQCLPWVVNP